jgi:hypothetical protein
MYWLIFLIALQIGDVFTTYLILKNGRELNPVMAWIFGKLGEPEGLALKAVLVGTVGILFYINYPIILIPLCALYTTVVGWNLYQIIKQ